MIRPKDTLGALGEPPEEKLLTPEEEAALLEKMDAVRAEKRAALLDPGPGWRDWFLMSGAKWWIGVGFLVVDSWIAAFWIQTGPVVLLGPSLVAAVYGEFLLYRYLWFRPADDDPGLHGPFRPTPLRLSRVGRWTPEAAQLRAGASDLGADGTPSPRDFL